MKAKEILLNRLFNQQIAATECATAREIVTHLGAMQAQEYAMAKWAIALRLDAGHTDADIETSFNNGEILRTHIMRPTWHFVAPEDIRWMLSLCGPRVLGGNKSMEKQLELDTKVFTKCNKILEKVLAGNTYLTREEIRTELEKAVKVGDGQRLAYIMMQAEQIALICSGPRKGKQFTYALLDERAPFVKPIAREEALAKLTERYFASRGPATVHDMAVWSGLTLKDVREGVSNLPKDFIHVIVDEKEYIFRPSEISENKKHQSSFLMPDYDEYGMGYKDRSAIKTTKALPYWGNNGTPYSHWLVVDGTIEGTWEKVVQGKTVSAKTTPFSSFTKAQEKKVLAAVKKYESFINPS
jgi:hypothetical protein